MPPKFKFSRDEILRAALELTRESGISAVTARALAARLGSSAKPVFGQFENMEEVQREVIQAAERLYQEYIQNEMEKGAFPPYKASGMAYIRFAREETELFRLLFMRDRSAEQIRENREELTPLIDMIRHNTGLSEEEAYLFHMEMWIYVHGIATMIATGYLNWDEEFVSKVLSDAYGGLIAHYRKKEEEA